MTDKQCKGNCCDHFFDDYNEDEDDYEIQRLKDIIKICEFLIQKRQHSRHKKEDLENFLREMTKDEKQEKSEQPYKVWRYNYPPYKRSSWNPWWTVWF